jgi:hypothetical protein
LRGFAERFPVITVRGEENVGVAFADELVGDVVCRARGVDVASLFEEPTQYERREF